MATTVTDPVWNEQSDPATDALVSEARSRWRRGLGSRDRWASIAVAAAYVGAVAALIAWLPTDRHPGPAVYALLVVVYALVARVEFEFGTGSALPTELVLVPMLFVLPLPAVPLCVTAGLFLAHLRGRAPLDRALLLLISSWHAVGPVIVLGIALEPAHRGLHWSYWPLYLSALGAQFACDLLSTSVRDLAGLGVPPRSRLRFMAGVYFVDAALAPVGLLVAFAAADHGFLVLLVLPLVGLLKLFAAERERRMDHALELGQAYRGTAFLLGDVIEADDAYTGSHSRDVVSLTLDVCDRLGLGLRERRNAEFVALLHDVGKIGISADIIGKPGPLTPEERRIIDEHTIAGEQMLKRVGGLLGEIGHLVRSCHERWDGTGYPDGLSGEQIPLIARIVCAADAFSAMTTDRAYRRARPIEQALAELERCAGTDFDPRVAVALAEVVRDRRAGGTA